MDKTTARILICLAAIAFVTYHIAILFRRGDQTPSRRKLIFWASVTAAVALTVTWVNVDE